VVEVVSSASAYGPMQPLDALHNHKGGESGCCKTAGTGQSNRWCAFYTPSIWVVAPGLIISPGTDGSSCNSSISRWSLPSSPSSSCSFSHC
jgi:hypothetical protein